MIEVLSPAEGRVVGVVPDASPDEIAAAVKSLREAQSGWENLGPRNRAGWLRRWRDWLLDNAEHLTDTLQSESGKPRAEAQLEVPAAAEAINYLGAHAARFLAPRRVSPSGVLSFGKRLTVAYRPHQVVGVITPWNFPLLTPVFDAVPALLAGAAVLVKPSEVTPLTALELARGWREIGAPPVFAVRTGRGPAGAAVTGTVDFVQFTGSTRTGRLVAHQAIERMVPYSLELGGKDAAVVLADADLDRAVPGIAWGALFNSGQACISVERVYVEASVYEEFVARLTDHVSALRQGRDGRGYEADIGPMTTAAQREIVTAHVSSALASGAKARTGGKPSETGLFFEPTVLTDVTHDMLCVREETFGPVIPVIKVADADEAVRLANDSAYGLSATVWSRDRARAERIASRLEAGAVNINDVFANLLAMSLPQGGWKNSGTGARFGGAHALRKYCREQAITAARVPMPKRLPLWYPYGPGKGRLLNRILHAVAGRSVRYLFRRRR